MVLGGFQKFSLTDFPGHIAAILFTGGCNFRCPYCHNPELVDPRRFAEPVAESEVFAFLEARVSRLDGVVVTGGEPTIHPDLPGLLRRIRGLGLEIKLDTNGSHPDLLQLIIEQGLVDYVALDIKSSPAAYSRAAGVLVDTAAIRQSVQIVIASGLPHELRMTYLSSLVPASELSGVAELARGCRRFFVQPFQPSKALDPGMLAQSRPATRELEQVRARLRELGLAAAVR